MFMENLNLSFLSILSIDFLSIGKYNININGTIGLKIQFIIYVSLKLNIYNEHTIANIIILTIMLTNFAILLS
ncbi:hypothetical protein D3C73_1622040 [compost metagenome]